MVQNDLERKLKIIGEILDYYDYLNNLPPTRKKLLDLVARLQNCLKQATDVLEETMNVLSDFRKLLEGGGLTK